MAGQGRPTVRSRQVSAELRRLRKKSGLTSDEVGQRLGISQSKVSRIETNQAGLRLEEVAALLGMYHVPADRRDELLDQVRAAAEPGMVQIHGGDLPEQWEQLIYWESRASSLCNFQPLMIPGLLQTAEYARAIIQGSAVRSRSESQIEAKVAARLGRQAMLSRLLPPTLHVLIYEPALRLPAAGPGVMARQLRYLAEMSRERTITVQLIPMAAGPHPGLEGPFVLLDFASDPSLVYLENRAMNIFLEEDGHVESYRLAWERIRGSALPPKRSVEVITRLATELSRRAEEPGDPRGDVHGDMAHQ